MTRERVKPISTFRDTDYEKVIKTRYKDFKDGYNKAIEKACNVFCHTGCPHKIDLFNCLNTTSFNCLNTKCETWKTFKRLIEE